MRKRLLASVLSAIMISGLWANSIFAQDTKGKEKNLSITKEWKEKTLKDGEFSMKWDKENNVPDFIKGKLSEANVTTEKKVQEFLLEHRNVFNIENSKFDVLKVEKDNFGMTHYRTRQSVQGIPVYGGDINVHIDKNGTIYAINGEVNTVIDKENIRNDVQLTGKEAVKYAENFIEVKANRYLKDPEAELFLYENEGQSHIVYLVKLEFIDPEWAKWRIFVDASTGDVVDSYNGATFAEATVGTGLTGFDEEVEINTQYKNGKYYLIDTTKPMSGKIKTCDLNYQSYYEAPGDVVTDNDNNFNAEKQKAAVSAHYYSGKVYDYYINEFNRNSYDNNGSDIISNVHTAGENGEKKWNIDKVAYFDNTPLIDGVVEGIDMVPENREEIDNINYKPVKFTPVKEVRERTQPVIGPIEADR